MRCLTDAELQAVADDEGTESTSAHVTSCNRCRAEVEERRRQVAALASLVGDGAPPEVEARVRRAISAAVRGATALRADAPSPRQSLRWASALATAAAIAAIVFVVLPRFDAPTTLSAAQIIDRSLTRMTRGTGVEILEYELVIASTFRQRQGLPHGPFRVYQAFDRGNPGHFKFAQYDQDGVLHAASTQDPSRRRRSELVRVDGRNYVIHITSPQPLVSIPEILQQQAESVLKMMQLTAHDHLTIVGAPEGRQYVIEMPSLPRPPTSVPLEVDQARVIIDGTDFRVRQFTARGVLLGQPFDVAFTLLSQVKAATLAPEDWEIPQGDDDVVIEGEGTGDALGDPMAVVLRELAKTRSR